MDENKNVGLVRRRYLFRLIPECDFALRRRIRAAIRGLWRERPAGT